MTTRNNNELRESPCQSLASDLFGDPVREPVKNTRPAGYRSFPGTGPAGETCGSCAHACRFRRWAKCALMRAKWTGGPKTDIRLRTPACDKWEAASE